MPVCWATYVDSLCANQVVSEAAIYGKDGKLWARSSGFKMTGSEVDSLVRNLQAHSSSPNSYAGMRLITLNQPEESLVCHGPKRCSLAATASNRAVIIAVHLPSKAAPATVQSDDVVPHQLLSTTEQMAAYLIYQDL